MRLRTTGGDRLRIGVLALVALLAGIIAWKAIGEPSLVLLAVLCLTILLFMQMELASLLRDQVRHELLYDFRQVEALFSLFATLRPELPLPDTRDWAVSPDFLKKLTELILAQKAQLVAEAGSGVSTLVTAYCMKRLGKGKVISLEHDARFAKVTSDLIKLHGLTAFAEVIHCPLVKVDIGKETFMWYAMDKVRFDEPIDILVVDGPPVTGQKFSRYPALPLLFTHLARDAFILLDDGGRIDETRTNARWTAEFAPIASEFLPVEKGAFLLRKGGSGDHVYGSQVTTFL
jgi:hypothetical protein